MHQYGVFSRLLGCGAGEVGKMKYAVLIQVDEGEWMHLSEDNPFTYKSKPQIFETKEDAEAAAARWNTGRVVEYHG
jgi:hypothetical protein